MGQGPRLVSDVWAETEQEGRTLVMAEAEVGLRSLSHWPPVLPPGMAPSMAALSLARASSPGSPVPLPTGSVSLVAFETPQPGLVPDDQSPAVRTPTAATCVEPVGQGWRQVLCSWSQGGICPRDRWTLHRAVW